MSDASTSIAASNQWCLAVDGGGSKVAVAALPLSVLAQRATKYGGDEAGTGNTLLAEARTWHFEGTGSAHPLTWPLAADNLCRALQTVIDELRNDRAELFNVRLALAGAGRPEDQSRVTDTLRARCVDLTDVSLTCTGDIDPLVDYASGSRRSLAVILGTGSVVACRGESGALIRAGGWGPLLGDACSGGAIGLSALRYVTQLIDEGHALESFPCFAQALVREINLINERASEPSLASMLIQVAADRTQTARLAGVVLKQAYEDRSLLAIDLLDPHLADIVWQIRQVARRAGVNNQPVQLNFTGGLAEHYPALRQAIVAATTAAGIDVVHEGLIEPLEAILACARPRF